MCPKVIIKDNTLTSIGVVLMPKLLTLFKFAWWVVENNGCCNLGMELELPPGKHSRVCI